MSHVPPTLRAHLLIGAAIERKLHGRRKRSFSGLKRMFCFGKEGGWDGTTYVPGTRTPHGAKTLRQRRAANSVAHQARKTNQRQAAIARRQRQKRGARHV